MGACGAFPAAWTEARGGMPGVGPCRRAHQSFARPEGLAYARLGLAKGQPPDRTKGGATATESGRDSALTRARSTVKCAGIAVK